MALTATPGQGDTNWHTTLNTCLNAKAELTTDDSTTTTISSAANAEDLDTGEGRRVLACVKVTSSGTDTHAIYPKGETLPTMSTDTYQSGTIAYLAAGHVAYLTCMTDANGLLSCYASTTTGSTFKLIGFIG